MLDVFIINVYIFSHGRRHLFHCVLLIEQLLLKGAWYPIFKKIWYVMQHAAYCCIYVMYILCSYTICHCKNITRFFLSALTSFLVVNVICFLEVGDKVL